MYKEAEKTIHASVDISLWMVTEILLVCNYTDSASTYKVDFAYRLPETNALADKKVSNYSQISIIVLHLVFKYFGEIQVRKIKGYNPSPKEVESVKKTYIQTVMLILKLRELKYILY